MSFQKDNNTKWLKITLLINIFATKYKCTLAEECIVDEIEITVDLNAPQHPISVCYCQFSGADFPQNCESRSPRSAS